VQNLARLPEQAGQAFPPGRGDSAYALSVMKGDRGALLASSAGASAATAVAGGRANRVNTSALWRAGEHVEIAYQHGACPSGPTITLAPQP
jgi:hypothetical protein